MDNKKIIGGNNMKLKKRNKKITIKVSNSSHINWAPAHDFDVFDEGKLILSGTYEEDTVSTQWVDTYDVNGNYDGSYQESGDFSSGYRNYNILDSFTVTINHKYVKYFPYAGLKSILKYFKTNGIILNW